MPASLKHLSNKKLNITSLLAKWKDGLYYTAAIVKCDKLNKKCLVCFEDGSEVWVSNKNLHLQLTLDQLNEDDDIVCCICDEGVSEPPNLIILCDVCQQGYHQRCHNPPVDSSKIDESDEAQDHKDWFCSTCSYILNQTDSVKPSTSSAGEPKQKPKQTRTEEINESQTKTIERSRASQQPRAQIPKSKSQTQTQSQTKDDDHERVTQKLTSNNHQQQPQEQPKPQTKQQSNEDIRSSEKSSQVAPQQQIPKPNKANSVGPIKPTANTAPRVTPYYPLSNQVRLAAASSSSSSSSSSSAAIASLTASSALTVGSSSGRTKQDVVHLSNKSAQKQSLNQQSQRQLTQQATPSPPSKHAVRKSGVNFVPQDQRQSTMQNATRSTPSIASNLSRPSNDTFLASQSQDHAVQIQTKQLNHNSHPVSRLVTPESNSRPVAATPPTSIIQSSPYKPPMYEPSPYGLAIARTEASSGGGPMLHPTMRFNPGYTTPARASIEPPEVFIKTLIDFVTRIDDPEEPSPTSKTEGSPSKPLVPNSIRETASEASPSQHPKQSMILMNPNSNSDRNRTTE